MKLGSVLALKEELLSLPKAFVRNVAKASSFVSFTAREERAEHTLDEIALGVAPDKDKAGYRLAVRLQRTGPLISAAVEQIQVRAKGEADVRFVGNIVKLAKKKAAQSDRTKPEYYQARRRPLVIGSSISDVSPRILSAGTLGCFVSMRRSPHYICLLTNNHVIAGENKTRRGTAIVQPGTLDGGRSPRDVIGELGPFVRLQFNRPNFIDAALGYIYEDENINWDTRTVGNLGNLSGQVDVFDLAERATVYKVGRTTGQTEGRITAFALDNVGVEYDSGVAFFNDQIEIEGASDSAFSDSGDSGSLIVDRELRAVGLLFAGGDVGGSNNKGLTYANPIGRVLQELKVDLEL